VEFFSELKNRRLVQIVVSFAAAGWIAMEVVSQFVERGILPDVVYLLALVVYAGGLAAAAISGWFHGERGHQAVSRPELALYSIVAVLTLAGSALTVTSQRTLAAPGLAAAGEGEFDLRRIGVLYFTDLTRSEDRQYLADGLTEGLIERLRDVPSLDVVSRSGSEQVRGLDVTTDSIARILETGTLVTGSVEEAGGKLRVNVALLDGTSGAELRSTLVEAPVDAVLEVQEQLTLEVSDLLREWLGEEMEFRKARTGTENALAWTLFQRGDRVRDQAGLHLESDEMEEAAAALERADSLFAAAEEADTLWVLPSVARSELATRWLEMTVHGDPVRADEHLDQGLAYVAEALSRDSRNGPALQARGVLQYYVWKFGMMPDPSRADRFLRQAKTDLEEAVRFDPSLASAWSLLSVIHSQEPNLVEAKLAAQRAYEADEFMSSAPVVLFRLYTTSYDLAQFPAALRYCREGRERFPEIPQFIECEVWVMGTRGMAPDPDAAWAVAEEYLTLVPEQMIEYERAKMNFAVAMVLARAGEADSARAVIDRTHLGPEIDPEQELSTFEALAYLAMGDEDAALDVLKLYLTQKPEHREGWRWTSHWWWRDLQDNPEFRTLVGP
jgi:TolB-like protein